MKILLDCLPLIAFFVSFKIWGIIVATGVLMAAAVIQLGADKLLTGKISKMHLWTSAMLVAFGSLTLISQDPLWLQIKVTVVESIIGLVLYISGRMGKPLAAVVMKQVAQKAPAKTLLGINNFWAGSCFFVAILNVFVSLIDEFGLADPETALQIWVNFKVWGVLGITVAVMFVSVYKLMPYIKDPSENSEDAPNSGAEINQNQDANKTLSQDKQKNFSSEA